MTNEATSTSQLDRSLKYASITPSMYKPSLAARNIEHVGVYVDGELWLTTGWAKDRLSVWQSESLARSEAFATLARRMLGRDDIAIEAKPVDAFDITWDAQHWALSSKPSGHVVTDDAGEPAPLLAIVFGSPNAKSLATCLCVARETHDILSRKDLN